MTELLPLPQLLMDECAEDSLAFKAGAEAHRRGFTRADNPYSTAAWESKEHRAWLKGWKSRVVEPEQISLDLPR